MIIETHNLTKTYGGKGGCRDICLSVSEGQIFGFLGPNGAGKSTVVKTLVGLLQPTSGKVWLLERPLGDLGARAKIGFLPENFRYHYWLTASELLHFHAALYRLDKATQAVRVPELLEEVGLKGTGQQRVGSFSKGMQQRLGIACALLSHPRLVFLDEPTSALDPLGRREVRELLLRLKTQGTTVFLNSHLLSEIEMVCDQVAFIRKGRMVASGTLDELLHDQLEVTMKVNRWTAELRLALEELGPIELQGDEMVIHLSGEQQIPQLARLVVDSGAELCALIPHRRSLEDLFVRLNEEG